MGRGIRRSHRHRRGRGGGGKAVSRVLLLDCGCLTSPTIGSEFLYPRSSAVIDGFVSSAGNGSKFGALAPSSREPMVSRSRSLGALVVAAGGLFSRGTYEAGWPPSSMRSASWLLLPSRRARARLQKGTAGSIGLARLCRSRRFRISGALPVRLEACGGRNDAWVG